MKGQSGPIQVQVQSVPAGRGGELKFHTHIHISLRAFSNVSQTKIDIDESVSHVQVNLLVPTRTRDKRTLTLVHCNKKIAGLT